MIDSIPLDFKISGSKIFIPFKAICTVTDKEFSGEIIVEYVPQKKALEYVDVENVIAELTKQKITAEELTHQVFQQVSESINPISLRVTVDVKHSDAHRPVQVWLEN